MNGSFVARQAEVQRETHETTIHAVLSLDGTGLYDIHTGLNFLDHMLEQLTKHSLIDLTLKAVGDLHVDGHHTTEDSGIVLGQAICKALGARHGITRFAHAYVAMDEALSRVTLDLSGRPYLVWHVTLSKERLGDLETELIHEWFQAFTTHLKAAVHVECLYGYNVHHIVESCYKALALALRKAITLSPRLSQTIPSTKGTLSENPDH